MNAVKKFFIEFFTYVKVVAIIAIIGVSFYSGMYFMSAVENKQDPAGHLVANIEKAFENTSDQPIIMIVPKNSLYENAKAKVGLGEVKRETIVFETSQATKALGIEIAKVKKQQVAKAENGMVQTTLKFWGDVGSDTGKHIQSGWKKWSDLVTFTD